MATFAVVREGIRDGLIVLACLIHAFQNVNISTGGKPQPQPQPPAWQQPQPQPQPQPMQPQPQPQPQPMQPQPQPPRVVIAPPVITSPVQVPQPPAQCYEDPVAATVLMQAGQFQCTATILGNRPGAGLYYALAANHCLPAFTKSGTLTLKDGRTYRFRLVRVSRSADLSLLQFTGPEGLPYARVAQAEPAIGAAVWHNGYGVDQPGNRENGTITAAPNYKGQLAMTLSVSHGDSGGGIFRADTNELVAVVCSHGQGTTFAGGVTAIRRLLNGTPDPACPGGVCPSP